MKKYLFFVFFLSVFISSKGQNDSFPTIGEVFNFEVGDTFQYTDLSQTSPFFWYTYSTKVIIGRQALPDTVIYMVSWLGGSTYPEIYTNLDSIVLKLIGEDTVSHFNQGSTHIDTSYTSLEYDTCMIAEHTAIAPLSGGETSKWATGLGSVYYSSGESGNPSASVHHELVYFHKTNGKKWGEYHEPVGVNDFQDDFSITVSPNPVEDCFQINTEYPATFTLYNALGQQVLSQKIDRFATISRNRILPGIYYWQADNLVHKIVVGKLIFK